MNVLFIYCTTPLMVPILELIIEWGLQAAETKGEFYLMNKRTLKA